jgi:hypothetical protein
MARCHRAADNVITLADDGVGEVRHSDQRE